MIILNTTFVLDDSIAAEAIEWIRRSYIPAAERRGLTDPLLTRVLVQTEPGTASYALHLRAEDVVTAQAWEHGAGGKLLAMLSGRYGERALHFHTYLEVI